MSILVSLSFWEYWGFELEFYLLDTSSGIQVFKGTVIVILSDSSFKEKQVRFPTVTFNPLFDLKSRRYRRFSRFKTMTISSHCFYRRNAQFTFAKKPQIESNEFSKRWLWIYHSFLIRQIFKGYLYKSLNLRSLNTKVATFY